MTAKQLRAAHADVITIISDIGMALHHAEQAASGTRYKWGAKQIAEDSRFATECAANACDMIHLLHGRLSEAQKAAERIAVNAPTKAKGKS